MASKLSAATSTSLTCHFSITLSQNSGLIWRLFPRGPLLGLAAFSAWVAAEVSLQAALLNQQQKQKKCKILRKSSTITYLRDFLPHELPLLQPWVFLLVSLRPPFQLEDDSQPACKTATQTKGNAAQHAQANTFVAFLGTILRTNSRLGVLALVVSVVRVASLQKVSQGTWNQHKHQLACYTCSKQSRLSVHASRLTSKPASSLLPAICHSWRTTCQQQQQARRQTKPRACTHSRTSS